MVSLLLLFFSSEILEAADLGGVVFLNKVAIPSLFQC